MQGQAGNPFTQRAAQLISFASSSRSPSQPA